MIPARRHILSAFAVLLSACLWRTTAFVVPQPQHPCFPTTTRITTSTKTAKSRISLTIQASQKNFVDEILDALDTMMGVSPLAETDLKVRHTTTITDDNTSEMERLMQRQKEREDVAPPSDALQKPSVAIFFALLGIIPSLLFLSAVQSGFRPFGLN